VLQVGSYRQPGRWLWLMHRPLAPKRIFAALALTGTLTVAVTVAMPLMLFLLGMEVLTTHVVDSHHYGTVIHVFAFSMMAWLAGAHACTSRHRLAALVLIGPLLLALRPASVWSLLPLVLACLAWLAVVTRHGFRANRDRPITSHLALLLTALALQLAFFFLIFHVTKGAIALGAVVNRGTAGRTVTLSDAPVDVEAYLRRLGLDAWTDALEASTDPRTATWLTQLPQASLTGFTPDVERFPVRHQLGNVSQPWWDGQRNVKWTFSHDAMMYHGRHPGTGASRGWWGREGYYSRARFEEVPLGTMSASSLHVLHPDTLHQSEVVRLPEGEWFTSRPVRTQDRIFILTNLRLLSYWWPRDRVSTGTTPRLDWNLPVVDRGLRPLTVDVAELAGGSLVSLLYFDDWEFDGFEFLLRPWQRVMHVDSAGAASVVSAHRLITNHRVNIGAHTSVPVASWWVSPPLYLLAHAPDLLHTGLTQPPRVELLPPERMLRVAALALIAVSLGGAQLWLRGSHVTPGRRRLWLVSCALIGAPALLSLMSLEPRPPRGA
jgi:hypothetical protein